MLTAVGTVADQVALVLGAVDLDVQVAVLHERGGALAGVVGGAGQRVAAGELHPLPLGQTHVVRGDQVAAARDHGHADGAPRRHVARVEVGLEEPVRGLEHPAELDVRGAGGGVEHDHEERLVGLAAAGVLVDVAVAVVVDAVVRHLDRAGVDVRVVVVAVGVVVDGVRVPAGQRVVGVPVPVTVEVRVAVVGGRVGVGRVGGRVGVVVMVAVPGAGVAERDDRLLGRGVDRDVPVDDDGVGAGRHEGGDGRQDHEAQVHVSS